MMELITKYLIAVMSPLTVGAIIGLIWLFYSFKNHLKNYGEFKADVRERIEDKIKLERTLTEKQALEMRADYMEKFNSVSSGNSLLAEKIESYIERSVKVDEEQTESINKLRDLILQRLLNAKQPRM